MVHKLIRTKHVFMLELLTDKVCAFQFPIFQFAPLKKTKLMTNN